jgi:hypothetical protein
LEKVSRPDVTAPKVLCEARIICDAEMNYWAREDSHEVLSRIAIRLLCITRQTLIYQAFAVFVEIGSERPRAGLD